MPTATVRLRKGDEVFEDAACGDGPIDAALKCIERIVNIKGRLMDFTLLSVTKGKDAVGEVSVQVDFVHDSIIHHGEHGGHKEAILLLRIV